MPQPVPSDLHIDRPMTNVSVAYLQSASAFVAAQTFPIVPVQQKSDKYYTYTKGDWFRTGQVRKRGLSEESAGGGWGIGNDSYFAEVYSIHKDIDDQLRANADSQFNLDRDATEWVTMQLLMQREQDFVNTFFKTGIWTGGTGINGGANGADITGVAAAPGANQLLQWNDMLSTPIESIRKQMTGVQRITALRPNVLVVGPEVADALYDHPDILERIKYTQRGVVTDELIASLFGVDRFIVGRSIYNSGVEGATDSYSYFFGKSALLVYAPSAPGLLQPSGGYIFSWNGYTGAGPQGNRMSRFRMDELRSDRLEGEMAYAMKQVSPDVGVFFSNIVA